MVESGHADRPDRPSLDTDPSPLYGGIELVVDQMARGLVAAGHDVTLFTTGDSTCPVPKRWALEHAEGMRIGMAVPELRHVIHAYAAVADHDVVHDHTVMGPFYSERFPGLPVVTTIHGPFNDELTDLYSALGPRVPIIAISHAQQRAAPDVPITRVIHHGLDASAFPLGDGGGDAEGEYLVFLGRMAADKGAHRAIAVARAAGFRLLLAAKMREPWERAYFDRQVAPLLGPDAVYLGEVPHERKVELLANARRPAVPHPLERAVRHGHARSHGLWHARPGLPGRSRPRGGRRRDHRLSVR